MLPRLYPILDMTLLEKVRFPAVTAAEAMLEAGAGILQWRCKGHVSRQAFFSMLVFRLIRAPFAISWRTA